LSKEQNFTELSAFPYAYSKRPAQIFHQYQLNKFLYPIVIYKIISLIPPLLHAGATIFRGRIQYRQLAVNKNIFAEKKLKMKGQPSIRAGQMNI